MRKVFADWQALLPVIGAKSRIAARYHRNAHPVGGRLVHDAILRTESQLPRRPTDLEICTRCRICDDSALCPDRQPAWS